MSRVFPSGHGRSSGGRRYTYTMIPASSNPIKTYVGRLEAHSLKAFTASKVQLVKRSQIATFGSLALRTALGQGVSLLQRLFRGVDSRPLVILGHNPLEIVGAAQG